MSIPNTITASRLVFFILFIYAANIQRTNWAIALFILAWSLDAIDGLVARRLNQATRFGYIFDKATDRLVLFVGLLVLLINKLVPDYTILILTKDIAALPAANAQLHNRRAIPSMGKAGRAISVIQGIAIIWTLLYLPFSLPLVLTTAVLGGLAGARYLHRVYQQPVDN